MLEFLKKIRKNKEKYIIHKDRNDRVYA